ncbi:MAG: wax ester/triacylglycerol synthase family O-acyltransferase [Burkholderiales bacterium]|nr:wax ester/triacylglycerol synthase family O-acyltransferase [Burkholderiales bacterium]
MNHLSSMDAVFLHSESAEQPMHVASLNVLTLPEGYQGDFYEDVKQQMAQRLHLAAVFTRKLAPMPFDLTDPVWVTDHEVDIEHHVRHVQLPKPGSNRQLQQLIGRLHSTLLDRSRPLWEMVIIDGLKTGEVALYIKAHHASIDGQAGVAVGRALFDLQPTGRVIKPPRHKLGREIQLGVAEMASAALRNAALKYVKLLKLMPSMARAAVSLVTAKDESGQRRLKLKLSGLTKIELAPRTPLNVAITNQRSFAGRTVPVAEVKQIAQGLDVSFNDVVMGTVAGALRRYLRESDELPAKSMNAGVPVSLRDANDASNNNQVSMILADLATNEADPVQRLRRIHDSSTRNKDRLGQFRSAIPTDFPVFGAPWLVSGLAAMYGRSRLANWMPPIFNLVISNVAGIPTQLYFAGAKVVSYYPVSIVTHGNALNVTVQSYNGRLDYGLVACRKALPDLNDLGDHVLAEHRALLALAQQRQQEQASTALVPVVKPAARPARTAAAKPKPGKPAKAALAAPPAKPSRRTTSGGRKASQAAVRQATTS